MRRFMIGLACLVSLLAAGCSEERVAGPDPAPGDQPAMTADVQALAAELVRQAGWPAEPEGTAELEPIEQCHGFHCPILTFERAPVTGDIVHYSAHVRIGPGEYDRVGIHRVVRETRPWRPIRTSKAVFLQHGDIKDFTGLFLPGVASPRQPDEVGLAVQLAAAGVDVWGIDQAWSLVPDGLSDYGFLLDFDMDRCIADLGFCMEVARVTRLLTGNGYRKLVLLGYSSGAALGFAYLNEESQLPSGCQKVGGFIPVDYGLKSDSETFLAGCRLDLEFLLALPQGRFDNPFVYFGPPALIDPEGPSGLIPGLTNRQAAIGLAAWPPYPGIAGYSYHFLAGEFDGSGTPVGLQYTLFDNWVDFMIAAPPIEAAPFMIDYTRTMLPESEVPWDDHLADITTPILYLSALGGAGPYGLHTLDLIASTDVTVLDFGFHPPEEVLLDFGHIDLFLAAGVDGFVWTPVRDWILSHTP